MAADSEATRQVFGRYLEEHGGDGPIGAVAALLAGGEVERAAYDGVLGARRTEWLTPALLDLVLFYVADRLRHHRLTADEQAAVREMKLLLRIREGDFLRHRPAEVAALLGEAVERMLEDDQIDDVEALQQVELQRIFDLGYDEYLVLVRPVLEDTVDRLFRRTEEGASEEAREEAYARLEALGTVYLLSASQQRRVRRRA